MRLQKLNEATNGSHPGQPTRLEGVSRSRKISAAVFGGGSSRLRTVALIVVVALVPMAIAPVFAGRPALQKQKGNKKAPEIVETTSPAFPLSDTQAIDLLISQMLGAWQVGDVEAMHKYYADDLTTISGAWEPPLFGWQNYVSAYRAQRAQLEGGRLQRTNTYTKLMGDLAWVTYQWNFAGEVDGNLVNAVGHTTLLLQKRAGNWIIILNHTSAVPNSGQPESAAAVPPGAQPALPSPSHPK
jgi:uncharacterized protein (TIGR02246 family)